jgi:hypothetical protein
MSKLAGLAGGPGLAVTATAVIVIGGGLGLYALGVLSQGEVPDQEQPVVSSAEPQAETDQTTQAKPDPVTPDLPQLPQISNFRLAPDGALLVAGTASAGWDVAVLLDGAELTRVPTDPSGDFVAFHDITPSSEPRILTVNTYAPEGGTILESKDEIIVAPMAAPLEVAKSPDPAILDIDQTPPDADTGEIDYEAMREVALREKPKLIIAGFSAYSRNLDYQKFVDIAREVGAITLADMAHIAGLIAGGALENPFDAGFDLITTTTHKTLRGPRGGMILVREDEELFKKINKAVFPGLQGGPHMHLIAAKAVAFGEAQHPSFKEYARAIIANAQAMAEVFAKHDIRMLGGGTDNHLILADLTNLGISGKEAETVLDEVGITLNKNAIADDPRGAMDPSGIRFGTPAITTRGFTQTECAQVAEWMVEALQNHDNQEVKDRVREDIKSLCVQYPIPVSFV